MLVLEGESSSLYENKPLQPSQSQVQRQEKEFFYLLLLWAFAAAMHGPLHKDPVEEPFTKQ